MKPDCYSLGILVVSRMSRKAENRRSSKGGYTLIELLAVMFIITGCLLTGDFVGRHFGKWPGIGAGVFGGAICFAIVALFYRWGWRRDKRQLLELKQKFCTIYRVVRLPSVQESIIKPVGAEIKVGDYGWEAAPIRNDGLIYLQGLTVGWCVVWHAGFRPEQVEKIGPKPSSQYDYWVPYWAKPSPPACPFPVQERQTPDMGLPHHSNRYPVGFQQPEV